MKSLFRTLAPLTLSISAPADGEAAAAGATARAVAAAAPLALQVHNADGNSFHVNAVLVTGRTDAVLIDTGFTFADAHRIAALVLDSGRTLKTIYVSHADPDFYFGAAWLAQWFPAATLVAAAPTVAKIEASLAGKLATWGPRLGANGPKSVPVPAVLAGDTLTLEGQPLEIRGLDDGPPGRGFVWIPSLRTIVGGVNVFAGLHAWTADTPTVAERLHWARALEAMASLQPLRVIAGHAAPGAPQDATQIAYTRDYLARFESEFAKAPDGAALIGAMQAAYPQAGLMSALDIGARVNKGEMKW